MQARSLWRPLLTALLAFVLLSACGRLEIVSLTRDPDPCDYYTVAVARFDRIANGIMTGLDDPVASVLRYEDAAREAYELLPNRSSVPDSAAVVYGDYLLALHAAREGDPELTRRYAVFFIQVTASIRADEHSCGA